MNAGNALQQVGAGVVTGYLVFLAMGMALGVALSESDHGVTILGRAMVLATLISGPAILAVVGRVQRSFPRLGCLVALTFLAWVLRGFY